MILHNCPGAFLKYCLNDYNISVPVETKEAIFKIVRDNRAALRKLLHHKQDIQPKPRRISRGRNGQTVKDAPNF
jgi:hypothetical protein